MTSMTYEGEHPRSAPVRSQHAVRQASHIDRIIGSRLRKLRKHLDLRQTDIASRIGVSFPQLQKYETGANRISLAAFLRLCDALELKAYVVISSIVTDIEKAKDRKPVEHADGDDADR